MKSSELDTTGRLTRFLQRTTQAMIIVIIASADREDSLGEVELSGFADQSSRLQAVVVMDGIANFRTDYAGYESELESVHGIASLDDPLVAQLSPVTHISPDDPPFLLIVLEGDNRPSEGQAVSEMQQLHERLRAEGKTVELVEVEGASHCSFPESGQPSRQEGGEMIGDFFDRQLK